MGNNNESNSPTQIGTENDWADVAAGAFHVITIKKDGSLWAWGYDQDGELGDGLTADVTSPEMIGTDKDWSSVYAASLTSFALKKNGTLWAWGSNSYGTVGDSTTADKLHPVQIGTASDWLKISGGGLHVMALKKDHSLWGWGLNGNGQLGISSSVVADSLATQVGTETDWSDVGAGFEFSIGVKSDGSLWSWGFNANGQLGLGSTDQQQTPQKIGTDMDWAFTSAGSSFAFAIKKDSTLWGWGYNGSGNLGAGSSASTELDAPVQIGTDMDWKMIAAAKGFVNAGSVYGLHTLGIHNSAKEICATGNNANGQLGTGARLFSQEFDCSVGAISSVSSEVVSNVVRITITPNPATDIVSIFAEGLTHAHLEIFDLLGKRIYEQSFQDQVQWSAMDSHVANGVYLIRISGTDTSGNPFAETKQLVIQK